MSKKILYIGNNLSKKNSYVTTLDVLTSYLKKTGFQVSVASDKTNKLFRLLDMIKAVQRNSNADYILIDTFSTLNFYFALIVSQFARILKIKYIPILHGGNLPQRIDKSKILSNLIFKNSYKNIAPSNFLKSEFEKRGYKTDFIPNILEIENYNYKQRKTMKPFLLWVRAFKELYNPVMAIKVLDLVKKQHSSAKLCMIGPQIDNSYKEAVTLAKDLNIYSSVEFTGVLTKTEWLKKSKDFDIFINTTNFDNTPVSVMEAMALGLPIVSTNVGGLPYLIENNIDGMLVDKENPEQMANAIIGLIENKDFYKQLISNAREKVEKFSWKDVKLKWLEILK